ncbi:MAG: cysteine desulfurase NifS [Lachnospiraceae bacterium]|nr:cysteine desulfurase NifS [Lachnospiraceae bacterium]
MRNRIYLDNAATTRVSEEVLQEMMPFFRETYANPSAIYGFAGEAKKAVGIARERAAALVGAKPNEIYFTAGGSESDNWAIRSVAEGLSDRGRHIITTKIEHHAVLYTCKYLEKNGYEVTYLDVDGEGKVSPEALEKAIRPDTILISVMAANNEIGTIQPIAKIGEMARERGILFHTDAVQAYGHIPLHVEEMHVDLLSASGHKLYGPKGAGILYIRENVRLLPLIHGGAQERGRRAGTLNVPGIVGFGKAAALAGETMRERAEKETALRDYLIDRVLAEIPYTRLNGHRQDRLSNNAHFCFRFIEGESLLILLDQQGICGSSGSACTSGALDPSHVLLAIGLPHEIAHGSLRLTLSAENTREELNRTVEALKEIVGRLRDMSPLYEDAVKGGEIEKCTAKK